MVKACSLMTPTGIKLLIYLHCPDSHHRRLGPTLLCTWWHIHHQRLSGKSRTHASDGDVTTARQACDTGQKLACLTVNEAKSYRALSPTVPGRLTTLDLLTHLRAICLSTIDTFSRYAVAVQVWAAGSGHTIGHLKLSCVICLACCTMCSLILMHQMLLNRLLVKVLLNPSSFLPSRYWCCRELQQLSQTMTQKTFWLYFPHFCLVQKSSKAV